jgi:hypothetical protein
MIHVWSLDHEQQHASSSGGPYLLSACVGRNAEAQRRRDAVVRAGSDGLDLRPGSV